MRPSHSRPLHSPATIFAIALLFSSLCGCALAPQSQGADPLASPSAGAAQPAAQILFCDAPGISCAPATSFSVSRLRDLNIVINWAKLAPGNHAERIAVSHAAGGLYQSFHKSFLVPEGSSSFSTSYALPVAGTWIAQRHLTGAWTVRASLDGHLAATQTVTLTP